MTQYARSLILGLLILPFMAVVSTFAQDRISLIPYPNTLEIREGEFVFPAVMHVYAFDEFSELTALLQEHPYGHFAPVERIKSHKRIPESGLRLILARDEDKLPADAYRLVVDTGGIAITAHQSTAIINGILTLLQLAYTQPDGRVLPAMMIEDHPRFAYRGILLDVSKHYYPLSFLKKFIDLMALYKFNTFHWYLADDAGWRLALKQYPELTQKAAWRTHVNWKDWSQNGRRYLHAGHPNASGGYYTQDEARELVAYAARKGITVVPEIEMPGHSDEVLAVYPELSCSGKPDQHAGLCLGNEETFTFLTHVLSEVVDIFPSEYIHIGGADAGNTSWKTCPKCRALMEKEKLKTVEELQGYAQKRMEVFLKSKGRKAIGWDEIVEGGLSTNATVVSRDGEEAARQAASAGYDVVMAPSSYLAFDRYQSKPWTQPEASGGYTPLRKVYAYEPIPAKLAADKAKHILGAQGTIWTAYMPTLEQVEYMAFPRMLALAEVLWSDAEKRDWTDFHERLQAHYPLLQNLHVNYYRPSYGVDITVRFNTDTLTNTVSMFTEQAGLGIRYTTSGEDPDAKSALYTGPIELSMPATVKAAFFVDSGRVGPIATARADIHKAIGKAVSYHTSWDTAYAGAEIRALVDGNKGGREADDGQWQGFRNNLDVTIDFERREELHSITVGFLQDKSVKAYLPGEIKVLLSDNGKNFREAGVVKNDVPPTERFREAKTFEVRFDTPQHARYLRIVATNVQHELLLSDEVVVY